MMLEVRILKVKHKTQEEARKLLPYIQETDVYSMEAPMTEDSAKFHKDDWYKILSENWSRSMFERVSRVKMREPDPDIFEYDLTQRSYVFRQKVPILFLERHSADDLNKITELMNKSHSLILEGIELLEKHKVDEFLQKQWESVKAELIADEMRDKNIANNINHAKEIIRNKYKELRDKEPLRLTVAIGSRHSPEKYTFFPVNIYYLRGDPKDPTERLAYALENLKSYEEIVPYMLTYGAQQLINQRKVSLTVREVEKMSQEELYKKLSKSNI